MTETKFMPGPWLYDRGDVGQDYSVPYSTVVGPDDVTICNDVMICCGPLIASAPELYVALNDLLNVYVSESEEMGYSEEDLNKFLEVINARAALAKARGEKP